MADARNRDSVSTGIDAVPIKRIREASCNPRCMERVFTGREVSYSLGRKDPSRHLSGRFAAKEALIKALGRGAGIGCKDIEVINGRDGRPEIKLYSEARKILNGRKIFLSVAYSRGMALAFVAVDKSRP
ncbi:MAG: holo-ACP synthase [Deltaproteobacteria bacterium]|nr:holo-ACP synthase [Deltaproteobacteria bacterium]